jgi:hypothetical protein
LALAGRPRPFFFGEISFWLFLGVFFSSLPGRPKKKKKKKKG